MLKSLLVFAMCCAAPLPLSSADRKSRVNEVEVVDMKVERADGLITVEGSVRNISDHAIKSLDVVFRFEAGASDVVTAKKFTVDEPSLPAGAVSKIDAQLKDAPRAVQVHILALTGGGAELHVRNDGPFEID